jgi:hypothetical protein
MTPIEAGLIGGVLVAVATVGLVALARAVSADPAETAWVRAVVDQLDMHGVYDNGELIVYLGPDALALTEGPHPLGWHVVRVVGGRPVATGWTASRAELLQWLRQHYRTSRARG